jgi:hypothetical protein
MIAAHDAFFAHHRESKPALGSAWHVLQNVSCMGNAITFLHIQMSQLGNQPTSQMCLMLTNS